MKTMKRSELARRCEVNKETIRFYEKKGLLPSPNRTAHNYRLYDTDDVRRIRFIKRAQGLGFSLEEIKDLLSLRASTRTQCADVRRRARVKLEDIAAKIHQLEAMRAALNQLVEQCQDGTSSDCPILESLEQEDEGDSR